MIFEARPGGWPGPSKQAVLAGVDAPSFEVPPVATMAVSHQPSQPPESQTRHQAVMCCFAQAFFGNRTVAAEALRVYVENYNVKPFWLTSEYRNTRKADPYYCE